MRIIVVIMIAVVAQMGFQPYAWGVVTNKSNGTIFIKPENGIKPIPLKAGEVYKEKHDGLAVPASNPGKIFKTGDNIDAIVEADGSVSTSGGNVLEKGYQLTICGWKGEDFVNEHEDWKPLFEKSK